MLAIFAAIDYNKEKHKEEKTMQVLYFFESIRNPVLDFLMSTLTHLGEETVEHSLCRGQEEILQVLPFYPIVGQEQGSGAPCP